MKVTRYSKQDAIRLASEWRQAAATGAYRRAALREEDVAAWRSRAANGVRFLHEGETIAGTVEFDANEVIPRPEEMCHERLGLDSAWFFGNDYGWALSGNHEDWNLIELAEASTDQPA